MRSTLYRKQKGPTVLAAGYPSLGVFTRYVEGVRSGRKGQCGYSNGLPPSHAELPPLLGNAELQGEM